MKVAKADGAWQKQFLSRVLVLFSSGICLD